MMTCCSAIACGCSPWPRSSGTCAAACRAMGVHRSTYYRLKRKVDRFGLEALNVRERRRPRMPNQIGPHLEQRILAFALARPGLRAAADLLRAAAREVGRDPGLRARRLAGAAAIQPEHPLQAPGARRPPRRALRGRPELAAARAPHRRLRPRREGADGLLLRRPAVRAQRGPSGNTPPRTSPRASSGPSFTPRSETRRARCTAELCPSRRPRAAGRLAGGFAR